MAASLRALSDYPPDFLERCVALGDAPPGHFNHWLEAGGVRDAAQDRASFRVRDRVGERLVESEDFVHRQAPAKPGLAATIATGPAHRVFARMLAEPLALY